MRYLSLLMFFVSCLTAAAVSAVAKPVIDPTSCFQAASVAERKLTLPPKLLAAIAEVESMRADPLSRRFMPWPWTVNVEGVGHFYETKGDAIEAVRALQSAGVRSIDVGCMQVNLMYHPSAFASLEDAFDPEINANYAERFLRDLFRQTGNWMQAAGYYHSQTPALSADYANTVMARWPLAASYTGSPSTAATSVKLIDDSVYTPEFAATLKNIERDLIGIEPAQVGANKSQTFPVQSPLRIASSRHSRSAPKPG